VLRTLLKVLPKKISQKFDLYVHIRFKKFIFKLFHVKKTKFVLARTKIISKFFFVGLKLSKD